ncbi:MAG: pentapeptide repeat-containing protein [Erysipelotrichaceae bacterium]|nr:pentapeptide repeat-containing protein [Erysipelotrichaceae bacterium]
MKKKNPYELYLSTELETFEDRLNLAKYMDLRFENRPITVDFPVEFNGCVFERCTFSGDFKKSQFIDCLLEHCDLSNIDLEGSRFHRIKMTGCKGLGVRFSKSKGQYVTIVESILNYGEFADVDFQDMLLKKCDFSQGSFFNSSLQRIQLQQIDLSSTDFSDTPLSGLDISECKIDQIRMSPKCLKGLIVSSDQAIALASLLGIVVK